MATYRIKGREVEANQFTGMSRDTGNSGPVYGMCDDYRCVAQQHAHYHNKQGIGVRVVHDDWVVVEPKSGAKCTLDEDAAAFFLGEKTEPKKAPGEPISGQTFIPGTVNPQEQERLAKRGIEILEAKPDGGLGPVENVTLPVAEPETLQETLAKAIQTVEEEKLLVTLANEPRRGPPGVYIGEIPEPMVFGEGDGLDKARERLGPGLDTVLALADERDKLAHVICTGLDVPAELVQPGGGSAAITTQLLEGLPGAMPHPEPGTVTEVEREAIYREALGLGHSDAESRAMAYEEEPPGAVIPPGVDASPEVQGQRVYGWCMARIPNGHALDELAARITAVGGRILERSAVALLGQTPLSGDPCLVEGLIVEIVEDAPWQTIAEAEAWLASEDPPGTAEDGSSSAPEASEDPGPQARAEEPTQTPMISPPEESSRVDWPAIEAMQNYISFADNKLREARKGDDEAAIARWEKLSADHMVMLEQLKRGEKPRHPDLMTQEAQA